MQKLSRCHTSGLLLPTKLIDEKQSLKQVIGKLVDEAVNSLSHLREVYFLTIHASFDREDPTQFNVSQPKASFTIPSFRTNTMVFWVNNKSGICELLWTVAPKKPGEQIKIEFNKKGVAYLQAKGAMPLK